VAFVITTSVLPSVTLVSHT